ncbi:polyribonucleotide nucleotidyltransferase [Candidatus Moduliflexota bacterium]
MNARNVTLEVGGKPLTIETGRMAKQADGAVFISYGGTSLLVTAVAGREREGVDFLPLTVNYQEKAFAAGKIPGGFFRREGRPGEREVLVCRLIDRPLRPLFPKGLRNDLQIIATCYSADMENEPDIFGIIGASAALTISRIPFDGPVGAVRIGRVGDRFIVNPTVEEIGESSLTMVVAGTADALNMVEAGAEEVSEDLVVEALILAQEEIRKIVEMQLELAKQVSVEKFEVTPPERDADLKARVDEKFLPALKEAMQVKAKDPRSTALRAVKSDAVGEFSSPENDVSKEIGTIIEEMEKREARKMIAGGNRVDGRSHSDVRPITCEVGILPRTHSSALFTRGQTQSLVVTTLGTSQDEQIVDDLSLTTRRSFMLHYNFPPFSTGETRFMLSPGRREIGHGALAHRAIVPILPDKDKFPYTIRIVSDILESNGSSSMATVCGATLSLMDAGVPIKAPVAGIAMGLVREGDDFFILSDILGMEDHYGDMDFKVAGTREGITSLQMDLKVKGLTREVMARALAQAREGRLHILDRMAEAIAEPRDDISAYAPRILTIKIKVDKIRDIIGPGGKMIRSIVERTGAKIEVQDDGTVLIASVDEESSSHAMEIINELTQEPEVGRIYKGTVKKVLDFGAFVEIFAGTEGLCHISQLAEYRVKDIYEEVSEGDEMVVKVLDIDRDGKIKLSRKEALKESPASPEQG